MEPIKPKLGKEHGEIQGPGEEEQSQSKGIQGISRDSSWELWLSGWLRVAGTQCEEVILAEQKKQTNKRLQPRKYTSYIWKQLCKSRIYSRHNNVDL